VSCWPSFDKVVVDDGELTASVLNCDVDEQPFTASRDWFDGLAAGGSAWGCFFRHQLRNSHVKVENCLSSVMHYN